MNGDFIRILDGNTFLVCDGRGDIEASPATPAGLFAFDTRFLSRWRLTINGERVQALATDDTQYFETRFFLVPGEPTHYVDAKLSLIREQSVCRSLDERLTLLNHDNKVADLSIRLEAGADFADVFEIGEPQKIGRGRHYTRVEEERLILGYRREKFWRETVISTAEPVDVDEQGLTFTIRIDPHSQWTASVHVATVVYGPHERDWRASLAGHHPRSSEEIRRELDEWLDRAPRLVCDWAPLARAYRRSLVDLAALRHAPVSYPQAAVPAGGVPWSLTIVGRDSILTSMQALPFVPELAVTTLRILGGLQGTRLDDFRDEEPGKILREVRYGESVGFEEQPHSPYYGSADVTPLYVILLDEYERWTGDRDLVRLLEREARAALDWIDRYGDMLGNGYLWYLRRNEVAGLENQCWKESPDAISYHDGRLPGLPRATCELQGYVYDAKMRAARLARACWGDPAFAERLEAEATDLKRRFNRDFWIEDREYYALALDPDGRPVDALASNMGHLLWSGIVDPPRARKVVEHLLGPRLFSGWGIRTLAVGEGRYNPLGYHVGTVWPFDNAFTAWGLGRYGFHGEAARIAEALIDAAEYFQGRLPEAFGGYDREQTRAPVPYPAASSPHALSTGTPLLLLRTMLDMQPYGAHLTVDPALPAKIGWIALLDIPGRWGRLDVCGRGPGQPEAALSQVRPEPGVSSTGPPR